MARTLTARQRQVLDAVRTYRAERGYIPSIRELGRMLGITSLRGVTAHLDALEKKGWIVRERTSRSIRILAPDLGLPDHEPVRPIPLLGTIAAGVPLLAVENIESYVPVPSEMAGSGDGVFALILRGDSMIGDHLTDGDTILVRSQPAAEDGEIVAVLIGEEATVKRLDARSSPPRLLPSNPNYDPIELVGDDVRILGTVIGLIRRF